MVGQLTHPHLQIQEEKAFGTNTRAAPEIDENWWGRWGPQNDWCIQPTQGRRCGTWRGTIKGIGVGSPEAVVWGPQRHWCRNHKGAGVGPLRCWCEALTWTSLWCLRHWCGAKPTPFTDGCVWGPWSCWCEMRMLNNPVGPLRDRQRALRGR